MRAVSFSLQYSQSNLLSSLRHLNNTSLSSLSPFKNPNFPLSSFSNSRIHTQIKAKTGYENNSAPAPPLDPSFSRQKLLQVVLVSPQIPGNAGCIARTCAASAVALHLVGPLGFKVDDTKLKRAGLDYWPYVVVKVHSSWEEFRNYFEQQEGNKRMLAFTKRGTSIHSDFSYKKGDYLIFGSETCGLPPDALLDCKGETFGGGTIRIPMVETYVRCLNLSVSVGIALYEASRQLNYEQLQDPSGNCGDCEPSFLNSAAVTGDSITNTSSKVYLSRRLSYLRVNIIKARDLVFPIEKEGTPEVYVDAILGNVKLKTTVSADKSLDTGYHVFDESVDSSSQ